MKVLAWLPLCCGISLLAPALFGHSALAPRAVPLGVQSCDTDCQSTETDCDLACDQVVACVEECKKASALCAQRCREDPATNPDGPAKPPTTPAKKPTATEKKGVDKKAPPAKPAPKAPAKTPAKP